jgi:phage terminase large subunit GpA-like protein
MLADVLRPPERLKIADAAEKYIHLNNPGAYIGPYRNSMAWYMVEPANMLAARDKKAVIFVGPAQSAKTQALILNWVGYTVAVDPMDMIIYCPTKGAARDFSMRRIDRMHRDSKEIGAHLLKKRDADNKFDKLYDSGVMLTLSHPSVTEFAGRPIPRVALTDYDRMADDIEGDGSAFDLASKRTTTFGSFAMTLAESSPSKPITDPKYIPQSKHEAPPANGILGLYNRGDRRRRYWPCPDCGEYFEARFPMFDWDKHALNKVAAGESVRLLCPHCGHAMRPEQRNELDMWGEWVKDGQSIDHNGIVHGEDPRTSIASFWLNGVAASFISWRELVVNYMTAEEEYRRTGSEESLKKFYNNDLGEPYLPKSLDSERLPEVLKSRAEKFPVAPYGEDEEMVQRFVQGERDAFRPMVPPGVRFLIATVDVQKNMFVVQVFGIMPGEPFDTVIVDRFNIVKSRRVDESGEHLWVKPPVYLEDWDRITEEVLERSYPLADGSGRRMLIKMTGCDSGGREGTTTNA